MPSADDKVIIHSASRTDSPHLRLIHFNDVYHLEQGSREPVGGAARFANVCKYYRSDESFRDQPRLITLFSGDAFNPCLESSVTKGKHMPPVLNAVKTDVACVGNHDLDFGVPQFRYLADRCDFPWLLANVLDPAQGDNVSLGNADKTVMLTSSNGIKIGVIGLVEREWLDTINSLPPNLIYKSASATAKELCPQLRKDGAEIIIAITHAREPNDIKLANNTNGMIDIILGGHDHFYGHSIVNGTHILRSGTDFKQLSYIEAWKSGDRWDFEITRRDIVSSIPEDLEVAALVDKLTSSLKSKLDKPIGYTLAPLDARFTTVRLKESNLANFVCDLMRLYYAADCTIMAAGTVRGDQIYPPGFIRLKDLMSCFPFEDPVVVLQVTGQAILDALENSVSLYPALEGRFPQVSNIRMEFDPESPPNSRVTSVKVGAEPLNLEKTYRLATRGYMARGKDGYDALLIKSEGGEAIELVSEEGGVLISMILRQYFMSLKVFGRWKQWAEGMGRHWAGVHDDLHGMHPIKEPASAPHSPAHKAAHTLGAEKDDHARAMVDSDSEDEAIDERHKPNLKPDTCPATAMLSAAMTPQNDEERRRMLARKVLRKWWRLANLPGHSSVGHEEEGEFTVSWTQGIAPQIDGRITMKSRAK